MADLTIATLAEHVLAISQLDGKYLTNLQLNSIVYQCLKQMIKTNQLPKSIQIDYQSHPFYLWRYGPINNYLYQKYENYGPTPILGHHQSDQRLNDLNQLILTWSQKPVFTQIDRYHQTSFFKQHQPQQFNHHDSVKYQLADIINN